jgi:transposase
MSDAPRPESTVPELGLVRYQTANRQQVELVPTDLEAALPPGHAARLVWRFVEGLDLRQFYGAIKALEGGPGRPPIDPQILVALWLYATIDGVGSAREVARLCDVHDAYRWLRGGVGINHHTLSDFRVQHHAAVDALLTESIATLRHRGIVTLARVAQDGTRIRASAGVGSFRRDGTLRERLKEAQQLVARTQRQTDGGLTRTEAAQQRAAAERLARVEEALADLPAVAAIKDRRGATQAPRVSTTDPDARVMKMADGGFRPGYNVQIATDMAGDAVVGVAVTTAGDDHASFVPMVRQIQQRTGRSPDAMVVDAGVNSKTALTTLAADHMVVYAPVPKRSGVTDVTAPCAGDSPAVAAWRVRMATDEAKAIYRTRGSIAERVNGDWRRHRGLTALPVRGLAKVHTWALWFALAHNMLRLMAFVPHRLM